MEKTSFKFITLFCCDNLLNFQIFTFLTIFLFFFHQITGKKSTINHISLLSWHNIDLKFIVFSMERNELDNRVLTSSWMCVKCFKLWSICDDTAIKRRIWTHESIDQPDDTTGSIDRYDSIIISHKDY